MRSSAPHSKRRDIQGLRAVAVLAVVSNHLTGFPWGGFVGVDIFFVISGFVITLGLVREHENTGSISFRDFYFRRIARIVPAGTLAILCTGIAGYFAFFAERAHSILLDGVWALLFSANWRFALNGTDYWAEGAPVSPLQHYWSLGVEEQFYLVWPLLALLVMSLAARAGMTQNARRGALVVVLALLIIISFVWAVGETSTSASWAYFSTASRGWELGVGALLAVAAPAFSNINQKVRTTLGWTGVVGICASFAVVEKTLAFPAPWAALPVTAVALVIIAGVGGSVPGFGFLTNPVSTYVGNASYSLYLWHFPVIIILGSLWPDDDPMYYLAAIALMSFLAVASYEFVEIPAQRGITAWRANGFRRNKRRSRPTINSNRFSYLCLGALMTAVIVLVPAASHHTAPVDVGFMTAPVLNETAPEPSLDTNEARLSAQIDAALAAEAWPELTPSFDNILVEARPDEDREGCGNTDLQVPDCVFGSDKAETVVVLGDSTGVALLPTVRAALGDTYNVRGMTKAGCVILDVTFQKDRPEAGAECEAFEAAAVASINEIRPAMVILSNTAGSLSKIGSGMPVAEAGAEWQGGTQRLLEALKPSGAELVVVAAPPSGTPPMECATRVSTPRDCVYKMSENTYITVNAMVEATQAVGAKFIDTRRWFCNEAGYCPAFVGETPTKRDDIHTTKQYAVTLEAVFRDALAAN